jgi:hypothetical protein
MGEDREERARVYAKIAPLIMEFHSLHAGESFHVEELRVFVRDQVPDIAPDSPGRILRALRLEGRLNYIIINRRDSLYQFVRVDPPSEPEPPPPKPEPEPPPMPYQKLKQTRFDF